jgi:uncharacterized protein YceH (UPF0502 family)
MNIHLTALEARLLGCLVEKAITTPDQYPLSLNALTNACNQKSNRDPVLDLDERTVQQTLEGLMRKHLVLEKSGFGSRVPKYQHRFCNTGFGSLELRDGAEIEAALEDLATRPDGPFVVRLRREPGRRDSRYAHLFSGEEGLPIAGEEAGSEAGIPTTSYKSGEKTSDGSGSNPSLQARVLSLEAQLAELREELEQLRASIKSS